MRGPVFVLYGKSGLVRFYISGEKYYHIHCVALERGIQWQVGYWTMQEFNKRVAPAAFFCAISGGGAGRGQIFAR